jgi:cytochrome c
MTCATRDRSHRSRALVVGCICVMLGSLHQRAQAAPEAPPAAEAPNPLSGSSVTGPRLGHRLTAAQAARQNLNVYPDGRGLPPGRGTAIEGRPLFAQKCAACHGEAGRGATAEELAGGEEPLTSRSPDKTIGLYWPYATTVFDFTRRAMPMSAPGSLSADEVYAITAYLLFENRLIGERDEMNGRTLPAVRMPNRNGFTGVDAKAH